MNKRIEFNNGSETYVEINGDKFSVWDLDWNEKLIFTLEGVENVERDDDYDMWLIVSYTNWEINIIKIRPDRFYYEYEIL